MKKVYKYQISMAIGLQYVTIPDGAEIVHFDMQDSQLCIWAIVDIYAVHQVKHFWLLGTGYDIPDNLTYIDTVQRDGFVWHLFGEKQ